MGRAALDILDGISRLYVAKGKKTVEFDLKADRPDDDELLSHLLGRSGKLRAPAVRTGSTLIVGFNGEILEDTLL